MYSRLRAPSRRIWAALLLGMIPLCVTHAAQQQPAGTKQESLIRLPGHISPALAKAKFVANRQLDSDSALTLTVTLRRDDTSGFAHYLHDVYDPTSSTYRQFLSQEQLTERFGPSEEAYRGVLAFLEQAGFQVTSRSANRLTVTVQGTRASAQRAFSVQVRDYQVGKTEFFANDTDPRLPTSVAGHVQAITGLSDFARPVPARKALYEAGRAICKIAMPANPSATAADDAQRKQNLKDCIAFAKWASGYDGPADVDPPGWEELNGSGQTVGLIQFDTFNPSDVADFLALIGSTATSANVTETKVNGGATLGPAQDEVLLDIDTVLAVAPGAKVVVYDAPFNGAGSFQALFNAAINGGSTVISNSWAYCEDQTTLADVQSIDTLFQSAAASGISIFNAAGDTGSTCLDGSQNTVAVPADSPNATAVGGSSATSGPGNTYQSETWWDGSASTPQTGQGGFGQSRFFPAPAYQAALSGSNARSVPDVVANADPAQGVDICEATAGGCPDGLSYGGTSMSAPAWAAFGAILNQALGHNIGSVNQAIYPFAGTSAFHNAASMGSNFAHVGLGSPNLNQLYLKLAGITTGPASATFSQLFAYTMGPLDATPFPSADGQSQGFVNVRLLDANGNPTPGKTVVLTANAGSHVTISPATAVSSADGGIAVFTLTDTVPESLTLTATDTTDGVAISQSVTASFITPPAASGGINANPTSVQADGQSTATIIVTLKDALNRPTPGKKVVVQDGGAHAVITGPASGVTDVNGQIQFSATDVVNETVTFTAVDVTDGDVPVPGSGTVTYSNSVTTACGIGVPPVPAQGFQLDPYITGLPAAPSLFFSNVNFGCPGGTNPAFTPNGSVLVADFLTGAIYQTGLSGGAVSSSTLLNTLTPALGTLVYGKDGNLYAALGGQGAQIVQIDPTTGSIVRTVASGLTCPAGLSVDPLSGDLFFDDQCTGGGTDNPSVYRIIDPSNTDPNRPTSVVVYATLPNTANGGMAFAPNGTLYAVSGYFGHPNAPVAQISGTNSPTVSVTVLPGITSDYAVAVGTTNSDGSANSLIVEPAGTLSEVPIANPAAATIIATGSPGVGVTGPDGCLYSLHYDTIYRLSSSGGTCAFAPTSPAPSLFLTPAQVAQNPAQGSQLTFAAQIHNVSPLSGVELTVLVTGANARTSLARTDATGKAVFSYTGALAGADAVRVKAIVNGTSVSSNTVGVTWAPGKHVSFLSLNSSPTGGTVNQPVSVSASLSDVSVRPFVSIAGQTVQFNLGQSTCSATTNSNGVATCQVTPSQLGMLTLSAAFAGNSQFVASTASIAFSATASVAVSPPTASISVAPTSIALGGSATLTWSSTNATSCTASGSWSGTVATAGTRSVSPSAVGTYTYTLTCSNGTASAGAQAALQVTPAAGTKPVITWKTPAPITYGTPLSHTQLNASANVPGTFTYTPATGAVLPAGSQTLSVTFTPSDTNTYTNATATVALQVNKATPAIVWCPLPVIGSKPLGPLQLDAYAFVPWRIWEPVPGKFVYSPPAGTILSAGWHELSATFTPDNKNYRAVNVHVPVLVIKRDDDDHHH